MSNWYVIKTKPHKEADVTTLLSKANFEVLLPKVRSLQYRGSLSHYRTTPLFPTYLFLNIDFSDQNLIHLVKFTRGVSKILCAENKPLPISSEIIQTIQKKINHEGCIDYHSSLKSGDKIRVKKGMLKDLLGILEKPVPQEERVIVLLKLINYKMRAKLHWTEVEKLHAA